MIEEMTNNDACFICTDKFTCMEILSEEELNYLNSNKVLIDFKKGESVIKQGYFANHIYFVKKGLIKLNIEIPNSAPNLIINILSKGKIMGLPSIFGSSTFIYSAIALEDSTVCMIKNSSIETLVENNGKFASEIIKSLNNCYISNYNRLISMSKKQLRNRVAEVLFFLSDEVYDSDSFTLTLSYGDIAELTGMSKASVMKSLKELSENKLISHQRNDFSILDKEGLKKTGEEF